LLLTVQLMSSRVAGWMVNRPLLTPPPTALPPLPPAPPSPPTAWLLTMDVPVTVAVPPRSLENPPPRARPPSPPTLPLPLPGARPCRPGRCGPVSGWVPHGRGPRGWEAPPAGAEAPDAPVAAAAARPAGAAEGPVADELTVGDRG